MTDRVCVRCGSSEEPPSINGVCMREGHDYGQQAEEEGVDDGFSPLTHRERNFLSLLHETTAERDRYKEALEEIAARPMPDGNASCATELERIKQKIRVALAGGELP